MKNRRITILTLALSLLFLLTSCSPSASLPQDSPPLSSSTQVSTQIPSPSEATTFSIDDIPAYSSSAYIPVNNNIPFFTDEEKTTEVFENYSELDSLGRCGVAYANICIELMPTEKRESISSVKPSGWHSVEYDFVNGKSLYNRCHLIGFQLAGENANELNLITGTRYLNIEGMLPFEDLVADYVKETENHVLYRVTPIFTGNNLVADGVLMEGWSVEDKGEEICFNVFAYNVQPGVVIDYETGDSKAASTESSPDSSSQNATYILNTNSMKFHTPNCGSVEKISEANRRGFSGKREDLIEQGYTPCGSCKP